MEYRNDVLNYQIYKDIRTSVGWKNINESQIIAAIDRSVMSIVAYENSQPVGMARVIGDGIYNIVCDVYVEPGSQRRGIGSELVQRLIKRIEEQLPTGGVASIQLIAEIGKDGFYERLGFKVLPNESSGSGMQMIVHKKDSVGGNS